MASYKVEICGVNTSTLPILKESEKKDLFVRIKNGDLTARETYIRGNLRLVLSVIRRFSASNENVDDLFQIGCIGLIKSIDNFDPSLDVKIFHLCCTHDHRRNPALPQGQQQCPGQPFSAGYCLQSHPCAGTDDPQ